MKRFSRWLYYDVLPVYIPRSRRFSPKLHMAYGALLTPVVWEFMECFERYENNFKEEWRSDMGGKKRVRITLFEYIKDLIEEYEEELHIQINDLRFHNFMDNADYKESEKRKYICDEILTNLKRAVNSSSPEKTGIDTFKDEHRWIEFPVNNSICYG